MGTQPATPHPSIFLPPALLSPMVDSLQTPLTPSHPLAPQLCLALAQRWRRRHTDGDTDGQLAMQGCLPTPAPYWHRVRARRPHCVHVHTNTDVHLTRNYLSQFIEHHHIQTRRKHVCASTIHAIAAIHTDALACDNSFYFYKHECCLPPTLCCLACQSQMFTAYLQLCLNMCSADSFCTYTLS